MGIKLSNADAQPAVVFDRVFLTKLQIDQPISTLHASPLMYNVLIEYRMFGVDINGVRHFQGDTREIIIKDYFSAAMQKAQSGDMDMIVALQSIEAAIASIIGDQTGTVAEVVA